jgi:hypothetical protein
MRQKREKGYWEKITEKYSKGSDAKSRVSEMRASDHISHVTVEKKGEDYIVGYSIAK